MYNNYPYQCEKMQDDTFCDLSLCSVQGLVVHSATMMCVHSATMMNAAVHVCVRSSGCHSTPLNKSCVQDGPTFNSTGRASF